jgi:cephalosporin-C deacetylase-like acetyl esterase
MTDGDLLIRLILIVMGFYLVHEAGHLVAGSVQGGGIGAFCFGTWRKFIPVSSSLLDLHVLFG